MLDHFLSLPLAMQVLLAGLFTWFCTILDQPLSFSLKR
ncbi:putative membrane protein [Glaesserella parasuis 12939]|nr:putative membrane protein [Glaesserella parasuis MN-H]EQA05770.1 putative membrane protein [Glaesserella parasuis 12939]